MSERIILQDNLWFRGKPHYANYRLNGRPMISLQPRLGLTSSNDPVAKRQELRWLNEYTGQNGRGLVIALEWITRGDRIDRNLNRTWLPVFERACPRGKWCLFYDPILAMIRHDLIRPNQPVDFSRREVLRVWRRDLRYFRRYFDHPQYWRLGGQPVLYVWAAFALESVDRAFRLARNRGIYVLADALGGHGLPDSASGVTGFIAAYPGLKRKLYHWNDLLPDYRAELVSLSGAALRAGVDFIPAGSFQYDDAQFMKARGRGEKALKIVARDGGQLETVLDLAWKMAVPVDGTRYLFWGTLNNWAESTTVLPTLRVGPTFPSNRVGNYGFAHLEAIGNVMFPDRKTG